MLAWSLTGCITCDFYPSLTTQQNTDLRPCTEVRPWRPHWHRNLVSWFIPYLNGNSISKTRLKENISCGAEFNLQRSPKLCERKSSEGQLIQNYVNFSFKREPRQRHRWFKYDYKHRQPVHLLQQELWVTKSQEMNMNYEGKLLMLWTLKTKDSRKIRAPFWALLHRSNYSSSALSSQKKKRWLDNPRSESKRSGPQADRYSKPDYTLEQTTWRAPTKKRTWPFIKKISLSLPNGSNPSSSSSLSL